MKRILSVSELNNYIKGVFDDELVLHSVTVSGELEEIRASGNSTFFTIKDSECRLPCISFSKIGTLEVGTNVEIEGGVSFYKKTAKVSFIARNVKEIGKGNNAHMQFLMLKDKLEKEGFFRNKKQIPKFIKRLAIITSETGAALQDALRVFENTGAKLEIKIIPVRVQGIDAAVQIVDAVKIVNTYDICDAVVFMRGGGSASDLSEFNLEAVARAVKSCKVFSISAIGHETDITLTDLVADLSVATPTYAAAFISTALKETKKIVLDKMQMLASLIQKLYTSNYAKTNFATLSIERFASRKIMIAEQKAKFLAKGLARSLETKLDTLKTTVLFNSDVAQKNIEQLMLSKETQFEKMAGKLDVLSPLKILSKGFASINKDHKAVTKIADIKKGDNIDIIFADGKAAASITETNKFTKGLKASEN